MRALLQAKSEVGRRLNKLISGGLADILGTHGRVEGGVMSQAPGLFPASL